MTINELRIRFDLHDDKQSILNDAAVKGSKGYLFVDSDDGQCYLFSKDGNQISISNLEKIEDEAFVGCKSLTSINIPDSVKRIGIYAFDCCTSLTSIQIPDSVKSIGIYAFDCCTSLTSVIFKGKTMDEVKAMDKYPWGIDDMSIIKCG